MSVGTMSTIINIDRKNTPITQHIQNQLLKSADVRLSFKRYIHCVGQFIEYM